MEMQVNGEPGRAREGSAAPCESRGTRLKFARMGSDRSAKKTPDGLTGAVRSWAPPFLQGARHPAGGNRPDDVGRKGTGEKNVGQSTSDCCVDQARLWLIETWEEDIDKQKTKSTDNQAVDQQRQGVSANEQTFHPG